MIKKKENESGNKKNLPKLGPEQNKKPLAIQPDPAVDLVSTLGDAVNPLTGVNLRVMDPEDLDKDTMIIMIAKNENKFGITQEKYRVKKRDGDNLVLEPFDEKGPEGARDEIAEFIVQMNEKQIKESAAAMVKKALMRKPMKQLERLKDQTKKRKLSKLKTKVGCVYLEIGEESVLL